MSTTKDELIFTLASLASQLDENSILAPTLLNDVEENDLENLEGLDIDYDFEADKLAAFNAYYENNYN